jgi:arylsulfatase A-like enzyme
LRDRAQDGAPFFLQCSFPDPHHPYTPPGRFWDMYKPEDMVLPENFSSPLHNPPPPIAALREAARAGTARKSGHGLFACNEREAREAMALNYGNITCVDDAIGRVHDTLKALGLDDNTVILFTSDHGDMLGDRGLLLKGGLHYAPLVRVPFLWRDTAGRHAAARTPALAQTTDIATTVLARAGIDAAQGMQGRSMLGVIEGRLGELRQQVLIEEEGQRRDFNLSHRLRLRTLVTSRYRLTLYAEEAWGELYDLTDDQLEQTNLWGNPAFAAVQSSLTAAMVEEMMTTAETSPYPTFAA